MPVTDLQVRICSRLAPTHDNVKIGFARGIGIIMRHNFLWIAIYWSSTFIFRSWEKGIIWLMNSKAILCKFDKSSLACSRCPWRGLERRCIMALLLLWHPISPDSWPIEFSQSKIGIVWYHQHLATQIHQSLDGHSFEVAMWLWY